MTAAAPTSPYNQSQIPVNRRGADGTHSSQAPSTDQRNINTNINELAKLLEQPLQKSEKPPALTGRARPFFTGKELAMLGAMGVMALLGAGLISIAVITKVHPSTFGL